MRAGRENIWCRNLAVISLRSPAKVSFLDQILRLLSRPERWPIYNHPTVMIIHRIDNLAGFKLHWRRMLETRAERLAYAETLCAASRAERTPFTVSAFSYTAGHVVDFSVLWPAGGNSGPNWRESLVCPVTGLNSRQRASVQLVDNRGELYRDADVYLTEQVTPYFQILHQRFKNLVGSEYLGSDLPSGHVNPGGIRHEDLTRLSFPTASFDAVLSFECLEHIPDFAATIAEAHRVLRPGGRLFISVPFAAGQYEHSIRARMLKDGTVEHLLPPEYHGDPMQSTGCLCFTHFGWQLLDDLKAVGFNEAHAMAVWSREYAHLGEELLFFTAIKTR
jgi:hypothetical protein